MATYAIGDVHGCFKTLQKLLRKIQYDPRHDRLWFVGDLVNRGPRSLAVLRWAAEQGDRIVAVLGNHDLHLLGRAAHVSAPKRRDSLAEILEAPDRDNLLGWLRRRPLFHREGDHLLVHAGLFPAWTPGLAEGLARETEAVLRGPGSEALVASNDRKLDERWDGNLPAEERVRVALAGFAKIRAVDANGRMCASFSGTPREAPEGCRPWFEDPERRSRGVTVVFGHWAALGLWMDDGLAGLDSGCAWGRELTALRIDDGKLIQQHSVD
ncbi:MAG TPA: symmetrical bis(5'-nucleosyl)-tetraphosphatase [Thermoanaerobaculia bacterium]|jgi:bis(5'-nucleosyl)-tetraphosphatase (symmetrical)|nr:symmetrical bis(5'-nucleosyl)-tetraphosphatase [Thermoanaerobaculia bacterium]